LPFGPGKHFLATGNAFKRKAAEGWEFAGVMRVQSGLPYYIGSFSTFNQYGNGIVLHNMTSQDLQAAVNIRKTTDASGKGIVYYLPDDIIQNTMAAFNQGGRTPADVNPNARYIGPAPAGQLGWRGLLYQNWNRFYDMSVVKRTKFGEG